MPRWVRVAAIGEIPAGRAKTVEIDGTPIAIFHAKDGALHALDGTCPHEDGPLGHGVIVRDVVVCPWHGFNFDLRTGACRVAPDLAVRVYPTRIDGGDVQVELP